MSFLSTSPSTVNISGSNVEHGLVGKPHLKKYADRLKAMDKDGNGELDIVEICEFVEEISTIEKQNRIFKWLALITGLFSLFTIAALVGLTYVVVDLTKDTKLMSGSSLMISKDTGSPIATATAFATSNFSTIYTLPASELENVHSFTLPQDDGSISIVHVAHINLIPNTSVTIKGNDGSVWFVDASGIYFEVDPTDPRAVNATDPRGSATGAGRRKLSGLEMKIPILLELTFRTPNAQLRTILSPAEVERLQEARF